MNHLERKEEYIRSWLNSKYAYYRLYIYCIGMVLSSSFTKTKPRRYGWHKRATDRHTPSRLGGCPWLERSMTSLEALSRELPSCRHLGLWPRDSLGVRSGHRSLLPPSWHWWRHTLIQCINITWGTLFAKYYYVPWYAAFQLNLNFTINVCVLRFTGRRIKGRNNIQRAMFPMGDSLPM